MADYLPLHVTDITNRTDPETGEVRITAVCRTVQPETINLNLTRLDAERMQRFMDNKGSILMVPIRRGEFNGRSFVRVDEGHIFRDADVVSKFELSDSKPTIQKAVSDTPNPLGDDAAPTAVVSGKGLFNKQ